MADSSGKKGKKEPKPTVTPLRKPENFEDLEKEFEQVLNELLNDESLKHFKVQYEKLHAALVASHESELVLMERVRELNNEISANATKVSTALILSKDDEARIVNLTSELEGSWKKIEYMKQKEVMSNEMISSLHMEIDRLNKLVQRGVDLAKQFNQAEPSGLKPMSGPTSTASASYGYLASTSFGPRRQDADMDSDEELEICRQEREKLNNRVHELNLENSRLQDMVSSNTDEMRERARQLQKEKRHILNLKADSEKVSVALHNMTEERNAAKRNTDMVMEKLDRMTNEQLELKIKHDLCTKDLDMINARLQKTLADMEKQGNLVEALQMEIGDQNDKIRARDVKIGTLNDHFRKIAKTKELQTRKIKMLTDLRISLRQDRELLRVQLASAEKTIEQGMRTSEADKKHILQLMHDKEILNKNFVKQVKATEKQINLVSLHERTCHTMGQEIMGFRKESEKQRRLIQQLETERDRYINENGELHVKLLKSMENCQMRDLNILDLKKHGEELDSRLRIQKNMFEAMHQDRNMYSRQLIETQDEMKEMRSKLRVLEHQSHQLKEEVSAREAAVVKEHMECLRLEKERDCLQTEIQMLRKHLQEVEQVVADLRAEEKNLQKVIANSDETIRRQTRELDTVIRERDILGSQLVRRNDELSLLYQKIHLLEILTNNANKMYDARLEDIRLLRLEVRRQRHENRCLTKSVANVSSYREELYSVHRELLHERGRTAALENELSQPRQIHRWRSLEVTDPSKFELLQKVQALQKRLITRMEQVVQLEKYIWEKDRLYMELRDLMNRQPGPEAATRISAYQRILRNKNRQLKSLVAEHNMDETNRKMDEHDNKKLQMEVEDVKKKYYKEKKKRQSLQAARHDQAEEAKAAATKFLRQASRGILPRGINYMPEKIAGGGFKLLHL